MNNVSLIGRLTADPELRHTQSGVAMTRFTVAVDRRVRAGEEKQADFISVTAWQQRAEFVCKYFSKGNRIALTGSIRTGSYTDRDGNKRYTTDVWADNIEFCESKRDSSSSYGNNYGGESDSYSRQSYRQDSAPAPSYSSGDTGDFVDMPTDEDLPF
ncbi:MAG: single-stranded DNA-binding protein [Clostridia bacterium]|nr:single-stranded DNA-binding protein [Clostridia bacterium]